MGIADMKAQGRDMIVGVGSALVDILLQESEEFVQATGAEKGGMTLVDAEYKSGTYEVQWDGRDQLGQEVESGVYIYRIVADDFVHSNKMLLAK